MTSSFQCLRLCLTFIFAIVSFAGVANPLSDAIDTDLASHKAAIKSQKKIDGLDDQTRTMLNEYRSITRQIDSLHTYNQHLQDLLRSQRQEQDSLQKQLSDIDITQREIIPLMLRMLDSLDSFVKLDLPFLVEERQQRLANLKTLMLRADVTVAEKYRRIVEAFQIENDYGKTIEGYKANLVLNKINSSVDFLRIGRIALYYRRLNGSESGYWNKEKKAWQVLSSDYNLPIRNALRIARKQAAPDLITLPVLAAETAK